MITEAGCRAFFSKPMVNTITSLMPTLDGLFLASVLDGAKGEVLFRYDPALEPTIQELIRSLKEMEKDAE